MLIDSHSHVNFDVYRKDFKSVIDHCLVNNTWLINIGSDFKTSSKTIELTRDYGRGVYAVVGLHPIHVVDDVVESVIVDGQKTEVVTPKEEFDYNKYRDLAKSSDKVVGLGEVGLDYFYFNDNDSDSLSKKNLQKEVFKKFIKLSQELNLPLVMHCRGHKDDPYGAYDDMLEILSDTRHHHGVIHCFGGNLNQASKFVNLGFYVGFTGIITFKKKSEDVQEVVRAVPLDKILIETDSPFLTPEPHRGQRNEPYYVKFVAQKVAELKKITFDEVAIITTDNAKNLFSI
ncbi:TatD family hydrolase [Candidatus Falkowbacteria bacterium]|uniref:Hydrolase TatD n=1 Tax=Candidatus Buchananbacteria bacterium CG10_big_fil_rev_8_21_14_0_10_33_19 TaxID=1974525 RepID=A0A2H0W6H4_9BACT|nr:TatD family hydrolase [Candidatus Falkowbacteria bacterium]PIS06201.1 MAG: hydrolase TatD [Candidatus Buchananbacteria bacterium CG10_big_fil_rev_8_21_14_0_10_33_19]